MSTTEETSLSDKNKISDLTKQKEKKNEMKNLKCKLCISH